MKSKRKASTGKRINPHYWVFCEGETEEAYVLFLRAEYRLQIDVIPKIVGSRINRRFINSFKRGKPQHEKDKDFLMYDADVIEILDKLQQIDSSILILSNPVIELWFLLHYKNQTAALSGEDCLRELLNRNSRNYEKGTIDNRLKDKLRTRRTEASCRSRKLAPDTNPSTNMHVFIDALEDAKLGIL
jgi:hypothetical protein